jgi:hypothetical protein
LTKKETHRLGLREDDSSDVDLGRDRMRASLVSRKRMVSLPSYPSLLWFSNRNLNMSFRNLYEKEKRKISYELE